MRLYMVGGHAPVRLEITVDQCNKLFQFAHQQTLTLKDVREFQSLLRYILPDKTVQKEKL